MDIFSKQFLMAVKKAGGINKVFCSLGTSTDSTTWILLKNGELWGCGYNNAGQQGSGNTTNVTTFTKRADNVVDVACSRYTTFYINKDGELFGCGGNGNGQQGSGSYGSNANVTTFTKRADNVAKVFVSRPGGSTTFYITKDSKLYGCGSNSSGQMGDGTGGSGDLKHTFTLLATDVKDVACADYHTFYISNDNVLYGAGSNGSGRLGIEATTTFTQIATNVSYITCSELASWYINSSGDLYGTGAGANGQQGNGSTSNVTTFTLRATNVKKVKNDTTMTRYLTTSGVLYGCGHNELYQIGNGTATTSSPYGLTTFTQMATNVKDFDCSLYTSWYINNNNELYGTGYNNYGQQGSGSSGNSATVKTFTKRADNASSVVCSYYTTWYVDLEGNIYGCGRGSEGQQGNGLTSNQLTFQDKMLLIPKKPDTIESYAFRIDTTNSDPTTAISYVTGYDNENYTPASMNFTTGECNYGSWGNAFFQPRPVMLKIPNQYDPPFVDYELNHNDFTEKLDGTASDVSNSNYMGSCMIAFPQVWLKYEESGNYQYVYVANWNIDGNYHCYTHQNKNGVWLDEIFLNAYEPTNDTSTGLVSSLADHTIWNGTNADGGTMRSYIKANSSTGASWDFMDYGEVQMLQALCVLMFKSLDSQSKIGAGIVKGNSSTYTITGATKDKGMFYSICNDGSSSSATTPIKVFGIENLWGNHNKWINGLVVPKTSSTASIKYKLCDCGADGTTSTSYTTAGTGYKTLATFSSDDAGYQNKLTLNTDGLFPSTNNISGSNSTYIPDLFSYHKSSSSDIYAQYGGGFNLNLYAGVFYLDLQATLTSQTASQGASLSCKPL